MASLILLIDFLASCSSRRVFDIETYQATGAIRSENSHALAYIVWSTVHGLASLLVDGRMRSPDDIEALARLTTTILFEGMRA